MSGYPTSRKYARTLAQAFPREHAQAITYYPSTGRIRGWILATAIGIAGALLLAWSF